MECLVSNSEESLMAAQCKLIDYVKDCSSDVKMTLEPVKGTGKWGMTRLWRLWMAHTAEFMANEGVTMPLMFKRNGEPYGKRKFNSNDAHELFTAQWLGLDESGRRLSWKKSEGENVADKGQRYIAMVRHSAWCIEKGINLPMPRDSEYVKLQEQENQ